MSILNPLRFSGEVCFAVQRKYLHLFMLIKFRDLKSIPKSLERL